MCRAGHLQRGARGEQVGHGGVDVGDTAPERCSYVRARRIRVLPPGREDVPDLGTQPLRGDL